MTVDILLAAFNGAKYLPEQLASLHAQTHAASRVIARDDGSKDSTWDLLHADPRVTLLPRDGHRLGPARNFSVLLQCASSDYVMCCDQDDVWFPDKILRTLDVMRRMEDAFGKDTPLLVHTDAKVVKADLSEKSASFHASRRLKPTDNRLSRLLVQNMVLGCTLMANRALLTRALPVPFPARMHDQWLALVAAATGHIGYVDVPTLAYRQHANNAVSARATSLLNARDAARESMEKNIAQAEALFKVAPSDVVRRFIDLPHLSAPQRAATLFAGGYLRHPWWQNALLLIA